MVVDKRDLALDDVVKQDGRGGGAVRGRGGGRGGAMRGRGAGTVGARAAAPYQRPTLCAAAPFQQRPTPSSVLMAAGFARQAALSAQFANAAAAAAAGGGFAFGAVAQQANPFAGPNNAGLNPAMHAMHGSRANPQPAAQKAAAGSARPIELSTAGTKMLVSNLGPDVSSDDLSELFEEHGGPIKKAEIFYKQDGSSLGQGEVVFKRRADADKVLKTLQGVPLDGRGLQLALVGVASAPAAAFDLRSSMPGRPY
jgi:hypothetical protein